MIRLAFAAMLAWLPLPAGHAAERPFDFRPAVQAIRVDIIRIEDEISEADQEWFGTRLGQVLLQVQRFEFSMYPCGPIFADESVAFDGTPCDVPKAYLQVIRIREGISDLRDQLALHEQDMIIEGGGGSGPAGLGDGDPGADRLIGGE